MTTPIARLVHTSSRRVLSLALLTSLVTALPTFADDSMHEDHAAPAKLVRIVREATRQFLNVNNAGPDYAPAFGCVSGPDHGAMGIHYINGGLVGDGEIDEKRPEAADL
jgi:hypothetical protein